MKAAIRTIVVVSVAACEAGASEVPPVGTESSETTHASTEATYTTAPSESPDTPTESTETTSWTSKSDESDGTLDTGETETGETSDGETSEDGPDVDNCIRYGTWLETEVDACERGCHEKYSDNAGDNSRNAPLQTCLNVLESNDRRWLEYKLEKYECLPDEAMRKICERQVRSDFRGLRLQSTVPQGGSFPGSVNWDDYIEAMRLEIDVSACEPS